MKKLFLVLNITFALVLLSACGDNGEVVIDDPIVDDYDDRGLVTEDCSDLENIGEWQPVWCDEFDVDGLVDPTKWGYDIGGGGFGNNELQYYTKDRLENASIADGVLSINAIKEPYSGSNYTSARLVTKYRGDWEYGRIQVYAKLPTGTGTWPAIWMLPTNWEYGGWPDSGEIDIMEHVGYDMGEVHGTLHSGAYNHNLGTQVGFSRTVENVDTEFHLYEMIWEPGSIDLYIDGVLFAYFGYNPLTNLDIENSDAWPFDQSFHLILNVAVGGNWGGAQGVDDSIFPTSMEVDYVRVYQRDYAGLDQEAPSPVENFSLMKSNYNSAKFSWDITQDDVMIEKYEIIVDDEVVGETTINAFEIDGLSASTQYRVGVRAVDYAGNETEISYLSLTTDALRTIENRIEAESYDSQSGVLFEETSDVGGGVNGGYINTNDYLEYIIDVPTGGTYTVTYRTASESIGGEIKLYGKTLLPLTTTSLPITGGWQVWESTESDSFTLSAGTYTFKVKASVGSFNINYFEFNEVE